MSEDQEKQNYDHLFVEQVLYYAQLCMIQMGKQIDPATQKINRNMKAAHYFIEMLKMLRYKTEGNLSKEEKGFLDDYISSLQMNYVEELENDRKNGNCDNEKEGGCQCHKHEDGEECNCKHEDGECNCKHEHESEGGGDCGCGCRKE